MGNKNLKSKLKEELSKSEGTSAETENNTESKNLEVLNPETLDSVTGGNSAPVSSCDSFTCGAYKDCGIV